jgi:hypothetical protein
VLCLLEMTKVSNSYGQKRFEGDIINVMSACLFQVVFR